MAYEMVWEDGGVYWKYSGLVTGEEILQASTQIYGDARFDSINYKYVNLINAEDITITDNEVLLIAYQHKAAEQSNPKVKNIIVARPDCKPARDFVEFIKQNSKWKAELFHDVNEADIYLGIDLKHRH